ncbi:MAG: hypothetical protein WCC48_08810 [Anaeromyxobacteraceae bacterium]
MKRIALLLAAVGLGSGCVVSSGGGGGACNPPTLTVDWAFVDASGTSNLACNATSLSTTIYDVDVYVDGVAVATRVPCTSYGAVMSSVAPGSHTVIVEAWNTAGTSVVTRDRFTANVASCGDSYFIAAPGEGFIDFMPQSCDATYYTYLTYSLDDVTGARFNFSAVLPGSAYNTAFPCPGDVRLRVPYGDYELTKMEETSSSGSIVYASKCSPTTASIWTYPAPLPTTVYWTNTTGCSWP